MRISTGSRLWDLAAVISTLAFVIFLLVWGSRVHTLEVPGTAEDDGYVLRADFIRAGAVLPDPFRPLLYSILAAGGSFLVGSSFAGGRLISTLAAGALLLTTYWLGRRLASREAALFALLGLAASSQIMIHGVIVATDMTFAAFAMAAILLMLRIRADGPRTRDIVGLGLLLALAFFTRYTALVLFPFAVAVVALSPTGTPREVGLRRLAILVGACTVFLLPHFVLTYAVFGSPLHNESWKNVVLKVYRPGESAALHTTDGISVLAEALWASPQPFVLSFGRELQNFLGTRLFELGGSGTIGGIFTALLLLGLVGILASSQWRAWALMLGFAGAYVAFICATFYPNPRFLLPILPIAYVLATRAIFQPFGNRSGWLRLAPRLAAAAFVTMTGFSSIEQLEAFADRHPHHELAIARELGERFGTDIVVLGTPKDLGHRLRYTYTPFDSNGQGATTEQLRTRLRTMIDRSQAHFVLFERRSPAPASWLSPNAGADFLTPFLQHEGVLVFRTAIPFAGTRHPVEEPEELLGTWERQGVTMTFERNGRFQSVAPGQSYHSGYRLRPGRIELWLESGTLDWGSAVGAYRLTKGRMGTRDALHFEAVNDPLVLRRWALDRQWWVRPPSDAGPARPRSAGPGARP